jgi:hypothetical protein
MRSICESADEHDTVDALEDELAARVVEDLPGNRVEVEARLEPADLAERQRQEVEEQRALGLRREGDHLALRVGAGLCVDVVQVGGLPAQSRDRIDQLAVDLPRRVIDEAQEGVRPACLDGSSPPGPLSH